MNGDDDDDDECLRSNREPSKEPMVNVVLVYEGIYLTIPFMELLFHYSLFQFALCSIKENIVYAHSGNASSLWVNSNKASTWRKVKISTSKN